MTETMIGETHFRPPEEVYEVALRHEAGQAPGYVDIAPSAAGFPDDDPVNELLAAAGVAGRPVAGITAGEQRFVVLDMSETESQEDEGARWYTPFGQTAQRGERSPQRFDSPYVLVHMANDGTVTGREIRPGSDILIGRAAARRDPESDRFTESYKDDRSLSRRHFSVGIDKETGNIRIASAELSTPATVRYGNRQGASSEAADVSNAPETADNESDGVKRALGRMAEAVGSADSEDEAPAELDDELPLVTLPADWTPTTQVERRALPWPQREVGIGDDHETFVRVTEERAEEILRQVKVHGQALNPDPHEHLYDDNVYDDQGRPIGKTELVSLTPEMIRNEGLAPRHRIMVGGMAMWFSRAYDIGGGRIAVLGYARDDKEGGDPFVVRSYYRSNSQGVWRYLPGNRGSGGYSKGYNEASITLPSVLQEGLTRSVEDDAKQGGGVMRMSAQATRIVFHGTARAHSIADTPLDGGTVYDRQVQSYPFSLGIPGLEHGTLPPPEEVGADLPFGQRPNLEKMLGDWDQQTEQYGHVVYERFESYDRSLTYTFCRDDSGRAWIGQVEVSEAGFDPTGLRRLWVDAGALTTPAFEYSQQGGGYADLNYQSPDGHQYDMYANYLSRVPMIRQYVDANRNKPF